MRVLSGVGIAGLLAVTAAAQQNTARVSAGLRRSRAASSPPRRRRLARPTCSASPSPAPATPAPSARPSSRASTSTGRASTRWPTTAARSTTPRARSSRSSIASPGLNPASWKYGLGWQDGTPVQKNLHQTFIVSGDHGWHIDGAGGAAGRRCRPKTSSIGQLEIWMNPHGFLKAARLPGANPRAVWRWELGEMGRDGPTTVPDKVHVVSITLRQVPHRRHHQQAEPDPAHPHDGGRAGARRLQLRARVHRPADVRRREVPDRLALAPGLGRQLRLRERHRRPQRVRRQLPEGRAEQLRPGGDRARRRCARRAGAARR